ncbi:uncharacterized protein A4U43_C04F24660 [Asparagus officinalis]|uniref:Calcineurin-like phosphoesterase domain-containing protein n=1 Tax=Asparagus officinalis TaxID=4686 RepID=A0A5P1F661_ASPOF|nr:uncharacterized protein A4U43_C04F24660 [Asparagus officinalis]
MASANGLSNAHPKQPLFSFGVVTDIQHADIPDGHSFIGIPRYYRHSLQILRRAVVKWNGLNRLKFSINFGDVIDGHCPKNQSLATAQKVLEEFEKSSAPVYHIIGNHCLYNLPRDKLMSLLKVPTSHGYYDFSPIPEYRFVVLDTFDSERIVRPREEILDV